MKVLFDHQTFSLQEKGGISKYIYNLSKNLSCDYKISGLFSNNINLTENTYSFLPNIHFKGKQLLLEFINRFFSIKELFGKYDIIHPTNYNPYFLNFIRGKPFVLTIHDMTHEKYSGLFPFWTKRSSRKKELCEKAAAIIAISKKTKYDLMDYYEIPSEKIFVIYHGHTKVIPKKYSNLPNKYILYVGERSGYKNFDQFFKSVNSLLSDDLQLVCVGKTFTKRELLFFGTKRKFIQQVRPTDEELSYIYSKAEVFVYPSLYEGFGLPILEAFAEKCPVALSNSSCFPEIAKDAAVYFNPFDVSDIRDTILKVLNDKLFTEELKNKGLQRVKCFTWEETAKKTEKVYKGVLNQSLNEVQTLFSKDY